jgi:hypothetical protein
MAGFKDVEASAFLRKLADLAHISEGELPGQRRLQVFLKELAVPAFPKHEVHVNPMPGSLCLQATDAVTLPERVRGRQIRAAGTTDLSFPPPAYR